MMIISLNFRAGTDSQFLYQRISALMHYLFRHACSTLERVHVGFSRSGGHRYASRRFSCHIALGSSHTSTINLHQHHADQWQAFIRAVLLCLHALHKQQSAQRLGYSSSTHIAGK